MAKYRVSTLDLSTRIQLATEMLLPATERGWGRATQLAQQHHISRTSLYKMRDKARRLLTAGFQPQAPGPKTVEKKLTVDRHFIQQAITILPLVTGSVRSIQTGLELLFDVRRSPGYISQTLQEAGKRAEAYNAGLLIPLPVLAEADEIFQGGQPCLTVVDGRSFLVLNLAAAEARDETHWGVTFLELAEQGIRFHDLAADGARGIRAGVKAAELAIPLRPDLFHLLHQAHTISRRLERAAYQAIKTAHHTRRAVQEASAPKRRRGRQRKAKLPLDEAIAQETEAIDTFDLWCWLLAEVRQALEPITPTGHIANSQMVRQTIQVAAALMKELGRADVTAFADKLIAHLDELVAPLEWLETSLAAWRTALSAEDQAFIIWVWQHREALAMPLDEAFPFYLREMAQAFWQALTLFHRSSSLAESLHSWVRPFLAIHRGMPQWLAPLLQLFWNHHRFERGKRANKTPLELAGVTDAPSLRQVLFSLFDDQETIPAMV